MQTAKPTQSKRKKDTRPPSHPARLMPRAQAICVDVGPGMACPRLMSSRKRCSSSQRFSSTKVFRNMAT